MDTQTTPTLFKLPPRSGKTQNVAVSEHLHRLIKLKATLDGVNIRELVEPRLEAMIEPDRERLEAILQTQAEGGK